jgi:alkylation response protein AidB-like acyl-CoA dehydrogenase
MDFSFSAEQLDLRAAISDIVADRCPPQRRREVIESEQGYDAELWRLLARELGFVGIPVSEANGGTGGSFVEAAVLLEATGAALVPVPLLTGLVAATVLDRHARPDSEAAAWLPAVATGERLAAVVPAPGVVATEVTADAGAALRGEAHRVIDGALADVFVVATSDALWAVEAAASGVAVTSTPSLDSTRCLATVTFDGAAAILLGDAAASARAVDLLRVGLAVEAVGAARHCLTSTVDYLKTREQFGRPTGSFQALAHRAADLATDLEAATSTAYYAAWAAADAPDELPVVAPLAKLVCTDAAYRIAAEMIQMHGGIGFTWEHEAHLYFKRATASRLLLGDSHEQRRLVAQRAGLT